jgi:DNA-binding NarL/FixJ family response regulator
VKLIIFIVEDCEVTKQCLADAIIRGEQFELAGSVNKFADAVDFLTHKQPTILLTDLDLPDGNGSDLIKLVQQPHVSTQLAIVITVFGDSEHVINALKAGASGYLLKDDNYIEINDAIQLMLDGGAPISPNIARYLLDELSLKTEETNDKKSSSTKTVLSPRENEVLILVSKGYTSKEIAEMLDLSYHTVREYISNIYKKLSVQNRTQAVYEATQMGLL